jgi:hypothetical protein
MIVVQHKAHLLLVYAHAKRRSSDYNIEFTLHKALLDLVPF